MAIRIHCPNEACGQVIIVPDEYAGKRGKCVACGTAMTVPTTAAQETVVLPEEPPRTKREGEQPVAIPPPVETGGDGIRRPLADAEVTVEASPWQAASADTGPPSNLATRLALVIVLAALVVLSFLPQVPWVRASEFSRSPDGHREREMFLLMGTVPGSSLFSALLLYSTLLALLVALGMLSLELLARNGSDSVIATVGGLAGGWGMVTLLMMLGFVAKAVMSASDRGSRQFTIYPGIGLFLGLIAALAILAVSSYLLSSRRRYLWLAVAGTLGFFFGVFLLIFAVRPWEPWHLG